MLISLFIIGHFTPDHHCYMIPGGIADELHYIPRPNADPWVGVRFEVRVEVRVKVGIGATENAIGVGKRESNTPKREEKRKRKTGLDENKTKSPVCKALILAFTTSG